MSHFDEKSLSNLKQLCRIRCTPDEDREILQSLGRILDYVNQLNEVDTQKIPPCKYLLKEMIDKDLREDTIGDLLNREEFLANAPSTLGGMIRVPPILKTL
jgi:aspartyl-tRNA(Asn)/glutamyl-tRNA(Gln) amidotransferase subunit C